VTGDDGEGKRRMAESLSLLPENATGRFAHDRLIDRPATDYLLFFGVLILASDAADDLPRDGFGHPTRT